MISLLSGSLRLGSEAVSGVPAPRRCSGRRLRILRCHLRQGCRRDGFDARAQLLSGFSPDELAGLLSWPPLDLRSEIREAIAAGLLAGEGDRLGFRHDLVREAVDDSLPKAVWRSVRRTAVEVMLQHGAADAGAAQLLMGVAERGDVASAGLLRRAAGRFRVGQ